MRAGYEIEVLAGDGEEAGDGEVLAGDGEGVKELKLKSSKSSVVEEVATGKKIADLYAFSDLKF